jgi:hypothetical protein
MGMQTDVKAASNTASATFYAGPARVKGIVVTTGAAAGTRRCPRRPALRPQLGRGLGQHPGPGDAPGTAPHPGAARTAPSGADAGWAGTGAGGFGGE